MVQHVLYVDTYQCAHNNLEQQENFLRFVGW